MRDPLFDDPKSLHTLTRMACKILSDAGHSGFDHFPSPFGKNGPYMVLCFDCGTKMLFEEGMSRPLWGSGFREFCPTLKLKYETHRQQEE